MKKPTSALHSEGLLDNGLGFVVVTRYKADGRCEAGYFLLDLYCLGVKNAGYARFSSEDEMRNRLIENFMADHKLIPMTPPAARKLVEGAAAYARRLGIGPHPDYKKACRVLGGIASDECSETFTYGCNGKPFYMPGPNDSPRKVDKILRSLKNSCGEDGFECTIGEEWMDAWDDSIMRDEEANDALRDYAKRIEREEGVKVVYNPPGRPKISRLLLDVATRFFHEKDTYEEQKTLVHLASLAWNFSCLPEKEQKKSRKKLQKFLKAQEAEELFDDMVAAVCEVAPGNRPMIGDMETDLDASGEMAVRVMSIREEE